MKSTENLNEKKQRLYQVRDQLKTEFFGLDTVIDRVIDSIYAWYLFPEVLTRPVIINLWGMTGVGKTQLVRRLTQLLNFQKEYVEIQMDGFAAGSSYDTISGILRDSAIEEGVPGILFLDEFQHYRTIDSRGNDLEVKRYQDVWMLLSDGKIPFDVSQFSEIEDTLVTHIYQDERNRHHQEVKRLLAEKKAKAGNQVEAEEEDDEEVDYDEIYNKANFKYKRNVFEARDMKTRFRIREKLEDIMMWDTQRLLEHIKTLSQRESQEIDYTKLLIIVSGNLDEMYTDSERTNDCDTDADFYYQHTLNLSVTDVKAALSSRFRPEQVSRLGNNHVIYPSLRSQDYCQIIERACAEYIEKTRKVTGINVVVDPSIYEEIYNNSVYPTQGTRPVFSSVHKIFSSALTGISVWAIENNIKDVTLTIDAPAFEMIGTSGDKSVRVPVDLDIRKIKVGLSDDFKAILTVHEAGHAIMSMARGTYPGDVNVSLASYEGGYTNVEGSGLSTLHDFVTQILVCYAGHLSEEMVFGKEHVSTGHGNDIRTATARVSAMIRKFSMDKFVSAIDTEEPTVHTGLDVSNDAVENKCRAYKAEAQNILNRNVKQLKKLIGLLFEHKRLSQEQLMEYFPEYQKEQVSYKSMMDSFIS